MECRDGMPVAPCSPNPNAATGELLKWHVIRAVEWCPWRYTEIPECSNLDRNSPIESHRIGLEADRKPKTADRKWIYRDTDDANDRRDGPGPSSSDLEVTFWLMAAPRAMSSPAPPAWFRPAL